VNNANKKISLLTSLRQTIATPTTPLIEAIQSVVSTMRTLNVIKPMKSDNKVVDDSQNQGMTMIADSNEENNEHEVINLYKSTVDQILFCSFFF
jgi:hypothetical protein